MALKVGELFATVSLDDKKFNKGLASVKSSVQGTVSNISSIIKAAGGLYLVKQAFDLGKSVINYSGQIEQLQVSFETMTGSAAKAKNILREIRDIAAKTPFEVSGLAETQQLLMNYGFTAETALDRMMMLGDIAQGDEEKLKGIATAYGQMNSAGKVLLQDVKQMIERGFNPLQVISESTGESMASLYDRISKGTIAVEEITAAMVTATSAGGRYFQSMEKQSKTLNGQISTLKDNSMELMGDVFQPMFDSIRTEILPEMNNALAELQEGYAQGGADGLADAFSDVSKDMLNGLDESSQKAFKKLEKKIPKYTENAFDVLPDALRAGGTLASGLTDVLFDVAGESIEQLIGRLPEYGPVLIQGTGEFLLGLGKGMGGVLKSFYDGIFQAVGIEIKGHVNSLADIINEEQIGKLRAVIDGEIDMTSLDTAETALTTRIQTLFANVQQILTDGMPDTPEVLQPVKDEVEQVVQDTLVGIDTWEQEQISKLDPNAETFTQACESIKLEADAARLSVETLQTQINTYIDTMAGKSALTVQATIGQLQSLTDELYATAEKYAAALQANSPEAAAFKAVRAGAATDEKTVGLAVDFAVANYKIDQQSATDAYNATIDQLNADFSSGKITSAERIELEQDAEIKLDADMTAAETTYKTAAQEIMGGLAKTLTQEQQAQMEEYASQTSLAQDIITTTQGLISGQIKPIEIPDNVLSAMVSADWLNPDAVVQGMAEAINAGDSGMAAGILTSLYNQIAGQASEAAQNADTSLFSAAWTTLLENAFAADGTSALEGVSLESTLAGVVEGLRTTLQNADFTQEGKDAIAGYAEGMTADDPFDMPAVVDVAKTDLQTAQQSGSPAQAFVPLGNDAAAGYALGMEQYDFSGAAGAMATSVQSAITQSNLPTLLKSSGMNAGKMFSSGIASGILSGRSAITSAARRVAQAAIDAANAKLKIASPSRVMMESGGYFSEGFAKGILGAAKSAVSASSDMVSMAANAATIRRPVNGFAYASGAAPGAGTIIDYDRMAEAMSHYNMNMYMDGKRIAKINAENAQNAQNQRAKSLALGYGISRR